MAGVDATDLHTLAGEFLAACVDALDTVPTYAPALGGAPERFFVTYGTPVLDCCDQLTVHVGPISEGSVAPGSPKASTARINRVTLIATIARCIPIPDKSGRPPSPTEMTAAAQQINADKWALWNHIFNMVKEGALFDRCCDVIWGSLSSLNPSGGCGGSTLAVTVCFDGYEEVLGS